MDYCNWENIIEVNDGLVNTKCGKSIFGFRPEFVKENKFVFCMFCGKKIKYYQVFEGSIISKPLKLSID